jgi:hypothetical protein
MSMSKNSLRFKSNHHNQVKLIQIPYTLCTFFAFAAHFLFFWPLGRSILYVKACSGGSSPVQAFIKSTGFHIQAGVDILAWILDLLSLCIKYICDLDYFGSLSK